MEVIGQHQGQRFLRSQVNDGGCESFSLARLGAGRLGNSPAIEPKASVRPRSLDLGFS